MSKARIGFILKQPKFALLLGIVILSALVVAVTAVKSQTHPSKKKEAWKLTNQKLKANKPRTTSIKSIKLKTYSELDKDVKLLPRPKMPTTPQQKEKQ